MPIKNGDNMTTQTFGQLGSWDAVSSSGTDKEDFLNMKDDGVYVVRVITDGPPWQVAQHWANNVEGKVRKVNCVGRDCPLCLEGNEVQVKFLLGVLNRENNRCQVMEFGKQVYSQIKKYNSDLDWGNPQSYDLKIDKSKARGPSATYLITGKPTGIGPITADEQAKVKEFLARINFDKLSAPSTVAEILRKLGRDGGGTPAATGSTWTTKSTVVAPNKEAAAKPDEDFDF